jgi:hypothetical protein
MTIQRASWALRTIASGKPKLSSSRSLGDRATLLFALGLVVKRGCLKSRQNRVLGTGQQDYGSVQALVRQLVYKAVQIGSCHGLRLR